MTQKSPIDARADQIYDELMDSLGVPELKIATIDTLETKYRGESPIERAARHERYEKAFAEAERILALHRLGQQNAAHDFLNEQRKKATRTESVEQSKEVERAEGQIDSLDDSDA